MEHVIDAQGKRIGRIATKVATILMGKHTAVFARNIVSPDTVKIINVSKADISEKKMKGHITSTHSHYRGGQRNRTREQIVDAKGYAETFRIAIAGMLPKNKLKTERLKHLTISE